jgi:hypothetical protein
VPQGDTGFTYASFDAPAPAINPPASLWAGLAPNVGVLQTDYTAYNATMTQPGQLVLPPQCAAAPVCVDVGGRGSEPRLDSAEGAALAARRGAARRAGLGWMAVVA